MPLPTALVALNVLLQHTLPPAERLRQEVLLGQHALKVVLLGSHLFESNQKLGRVQNLRCRVSITDVCMGWDSTAESLPGAAALLRRTQR